MSKWDAEFSAHILWSTVDSFRSTLEKSPRSDDTGQREHLDRLRRLLVELDARRDVDPMVVSRTALDGINNVLSTLLGQLSNYVSQPDVYGNYLVQAATSHADQVFAALMAVPHPPRSAAAQAASAAARAYRQSADSLISEVRDSAEKAIAAIQEDRDSFATATQDALSQVEQLRASVAKVDARVTEQVTRLDTAITSQQSAFETQQGDRADRFQKELEALREKGEQQLVQAQAAIDRQWTEERETADEVLNELHRLHQEAKALVDAAGRRVVTTEFGQYAAKQDRAAFWWSMAAVVFALSGFGFIAVQIVSLDNSDLSWGLVAYKTTASLALLVVAGFAAKQSAGHREQEKQAKRRQLEINALEPFLSRLPDEKAEDLRARMADRILVQPDAEPSYARTADAPSLGEIGSIVGEAIRAYTGKTDK